MNNVKVLIEKTIVLEFDLPGVRRSSASRGSSPFDNYQLDHRVGESWRIELDAATAQQTRDTLRRLAEEIDLAFAISSGEG
jgi:hypothetical protein